MRVAAVVPAAGRGARFGSPESKIWAPLGDRTVLEWTLGALDACVRIDAIVLVGAVRDLERLRRTAAGFGRVAGVVEGGGTRAESVARGLAQLPDECEWVLVHDAARPLVAASLLTAVLDATMESGAAVPGLRIADTVKRVDARRTVQETVSREGLWTVQTPQGARLSALRAAYETLGTRALDATDEAGLLQAVGIAVRVVDGDPRNIKVTTPHDLARAAALLPARAASPGVAVQGWDGPGRPVETPADRVQAMPGGERRMCEDAVETRTGIGYDVHAFEEGRPLWLGGVRVSHARGLKGHSDADVVLHAVCDALLGAACMGDIGSLFPDTDEAHRDRPSIEFLREVRARLAGHGWRIVHVDTAVLAEEPRMAPHRAAMVEAIAEGLGVDRHRVSVKATTSERLGFAGRAEGIACWATATIANP